MSKEDVKRLVAAAIAAETTDDGTAELRRLLVEVKRRIKEGAPKPETDADVIARVEKRLAASPDQEELDRIARAIESRILPPNDAEQFQNAEEWLFSADTTQRIPTGVHGYDEVLQGGLSRGVHVVAGLMGGGKTNLAAQCAESAAIAGHPALFVTFELDPRRLYVRSLARWADLTQGQVRVKGAFEDKRNKAIERRRAWEGRLTTLDATRNAITAKQVVDHAKRLRGEKDVLVVVDFAQEMARRTAKGSDDVRLSVDSILAQFSGAAAAHGIAFLLLSQVNRSAYQSAANEEDMSLSVFKESSGFETYADSAVFLSYEKVSADVVKHSMKILKDRDGGSAGRVVHLLFEGMFCRFDGKDENGHLIPWKDRAGRYVPGAERSTRAPKEVDPSAKSRGKTTKSGRRAR